MRILTWNVLHRVHAETHSEAAIQHWPGEAERVRAVARRVSEALSTEGVEVVLLQEVSGDVLAALRAQLPGHAVLNHVYPRVPRQRLGSVTDATEHLVVIAPPGAKVERAHTFPSDPGKGFLLVALPGGQRVASTHVSWGAKGEEQLSALARLFDEVTPLCVGGDFNCGREVITRFVSSVMLAQPPAGSLHTRLDAHIDHLLCSGGELVDVQVLEDQALSDHRPLVATLRARLP